MDACKVEYFDEEVLLEGFVAVDPLLKGKRPVVLIFPPWEGRGDFTEKKALELAKLGFVGCAVDLYGKGVFGNSREECSSLMDPLVTDRKKLLKRSLSYQALISQIPEADTAKIAAIGFCFGGLCVLDLARSGADIKAAVSFHGLLHAPDFESSSIKAKILAFHGYKDPMVSPEDLLRFASEMDTKKADFQIHVFGTAMHAFTSPKACDPDFGTVYQEKADKASWSELDVFLRAVF